MNSCDFCKFSSWCLSKAEDITWCFNKPLLNNAYEQGRADVKKEIEKHSVFYSNRPIEDIVLEARNDAIDEYMNKLCDKCIQTPNECWNLECPFADDECQIVKIAEQLKEQK